MVDPGSSGVAGGEILFWDEAQWRGLQARRLAEHLTHAARSEFYRAQGLEEVVRGVNARNLREVLRLLPVTTKDQVAAAGPRAWGIGLQDVREWVCTSGTAGRPLDVPLSENDLRRLAVNEAAAFSLAGMKRGDVLVLAVGMDRMFVAGLAYWLGGQHIGASCVRAGAVVGGQVGMLGEVLSRLRVGKSQRVFVVAVPSFLTAATGDFAGKVHGIIAIGEAVRNEDLALNVLGQRLTRAFGCQVMSTYASTETCTTFAEGPACVGGHLHPALGVVEILDENGREVTDGAVGEVVVTPLGVEGLPLVRFRTGDMAALFSRPCACGRTTPRLGPIVGRRQQLLKLRGTSVYPSAILESLRSVEQLEDSIIVAERDEVGGDCVTIFAQGSAEGLKERLETRLGATLRVTPEVSIVDAATIRQLRDQAATRKLSRFLDRR
jgi:phenylacetate-CoA ligase